MMRNSTLAMVAASAAIAIPLAFASVSLAQAPAPAAAPAPPAPIMPPSLPATFEIDLMTPQGSGAVGAQWRTMEAKVVEAKPIRASSRLQCRLRHLTPCRRSGF